MSTTFLSPEILAGDPHYARLKAHLVETTGLAYYADKDADLARRIGHRLKSLGLHDCGAYLNLLQNTRRGPAELDALIAEITIGETSFFRHREHFDALRDTVLPALVSAPRLTKRLRIWSAGCATGEEPYSLSILLRREAQALLAEWDVSIVGTDINRKSLAVARGACYAEWSLRGTPEALKRGCFIKDGVHYRIAPEYQQDVSFQYHNLVTHPFPSLLHNLSAFDVIVCRNVMIYFTHDLMCRLAAQFHECLTPGGWLLVGPSEPNMSCFTAFRTVNAPGVTLYQKPLQQTPAAVSRAVALPAVPLRAPVRPTLELARGYAEKGNWEAAAETCEALLAEDRLASAVHFLYAIVLEQMSRHQEAEKSLRDVIYLNRKHIPAHYRLGLLLQSRGDARAAARSFENAAGLVHGRNETERFPDAEGITAAELKALAQTHLEILRERTGAANP